MPDGALTRRGFVGAALAVGFAPSALAKVDALTALEALHGGRLGVLVLTGGQRVALSHRPAQRFAFCSSFKLSLAAVVLDGAAKGRWRLAEPLAFGKADVLSNSPALQARLGQGFLTIGEAAESAQKLSDNGATNLLLRRIGGLGAMNAFWRGLGDRVTRLDDYETVLNRVPVGSIRNTTTPMAMAQNLVKLFAKGALSPALAATLKTWMHETTTGKNRLRAGLPVDWWAGGKTTTGKNRLRAGLPVDWWAGDKTGTGLPSDIPGTYVDLAWVEPPHHSPFAIAAFYQPPKPTPDGDPQAEAILAEVGRIVARAVVAQGGKV